MIQKSHCLHNYNIANQSTETNKNKLWQCYHSQAELKSIVRNNVQFGVIFIIELWHMHERNSIISNCRLTS